VSYHIKQLLPKAEVTVFESGKVGGRLATTQIAGHEYETGGSIIHPANRLMVDHLTLCGLEKAGSHEASGFSLIQHGEIVFQNTDSWLDTIRTVLRYGIWSLTKLEYFVSHLLEHFAKIYPALDSGHGFNTVEDVLDAMSPVSKNGTNSKEMQKMTKLSIKEKLKQIGISSELIDELATIATKVNYGQFPENIHSFVGAVSLAGVQGGLWRVMGGNYKIPQCLLKKSKANFISGTVQSINFLRNEKNVEISYSVPGQNVSKEIFDIGIIAFPLTKDKSTVRLINVETKSFPGSFQRTLAYIVHGALNKAAIGLTSVWAETDNFFFTDHTEVIASISLLTPVDYDPVSQAEIPSVYKIFSRTDLSKKDIGKYFTELYSYEIVDWLAYPDYSSFPGLGEVRLEENLYYLNSIEWAASAMEMSALSAKNIANLIAQSQGMKPRDISNSKSEL